MITNDKGNQLTNFIVYINGEIKAISYIYNNTNGALKLVWQSAISCFGNGMWINDEKWSNIDGWKD